MSKHTASGPLNPTKSWIKPPIIVDESGDTDVFETIEYAERYLEPIDVEEERFVAFDSTGRLLG